ncbi:MAG: nitronate monooxygenase [Patescibacteria group bacterium]
MSSPKIIQGGMGVGVSGYRLARTVAMLGQRGTVSGVALERLMTRVLQKGDPNGDIRRALSHFPFSEIAEKIIAMYFVEGGIPQGKSYKAMPFFSVEPSRNLINLVVTANFVWVWLAKEGHSNPISINYLEKVSMPHIYAVTGAMLAGVDYVTMGAGIPLAIPKVLDDIASGREASYRVPVDGTDITSYLMRFDPAKFFGRELPRMKRPGFIPIIASNMLANIFMKKLPAGSVQGFVIEEPTAGGHNAPPRKLILNDFNEPLPIYGEKDVVDLEALSKLGVPFWIGGSYASPEKLKWVLSVGAEGIQAGSIFALSNDSDMNAEIRRRTRKLGFEGKLIVRTDMRISPTGFPFKVIVLDDTIAIPEIYEARERVCSQGGLIVLYERPDGKIGYRCPSEPEAMYVAKGGDLADTVGRGCLCNGLMANADLGDSTEDIVATLGDDVSFLPFLMKDKNDSYSASDAIGYLRGNLP